MKAKEATFKILDKMPYGMTFTGASIEYHVQEVTGEYHYPATILRYMREWRKHNRQVVCINNKKSLYMVKGYNK
jgi:hypothetical protein